MRRGMTPGLYAPMFTLGHEGETLRTTVREEAQLMRRSAVDLSPELQHTYMAAFHLVARRRAHHQDRDVVSDSEISRFTHHNQRTTRTHFLELGRDLLRVAPTGAGHLCVQGLDLFE